ncbi:hypothetical protein DFJ77DRAFT_139695 [Powellomyces hirtus]|nr:hypothetical protein DFJ77DRAFT_139695 [Powellomyces hirtus]
MGTVDHLSDPGPTSSSPLRMNDDDENHPTLVKDLPLPHPLPQQDDRHHPHHDDKQEHDPLVLVPSVADNTERRASADHSHKGSQQSLEATSPNSPTLDQNPPSPPPRELKEQQQKANVSADAGVAPSSSTPAAAVDAIAPPQQFPDALDLKIPQFPDSDDDIHRGLVTPLPNALRYPVTVAFGPRNGWFIRWSDGTSGWEGLPPTLHSKLNNRLPSLPGVRQLSMSDNNDWFVSFDDGSFATSGFPPRGKLWDALHNDADADVTNLVFAPGGGFLLTREDGTAVWERLPTGLNDLLKRRSRGDPVVDYVAISKLGGWFVMFQDRECVWEGLPPQLERILIQIIRKNPPHLIVGLSPVDMMSYFIGVGYASETNINFTTLQAALEWQKGGGDKGGPGCPLPDMNVNYTGPMPVPPVESDEFEDLFRRAAGGDNSDMWGGGGGDDEVDPDDEIKSSIGGGGSVVEVKLPSGHSQSGMNLEYAARVDGNVEAEEGGRLLLRAASTSLIDQKDLMPTRSKWSLMGGGGNATATPPSGTGPSASTPPTPTAGISSFFSSVFGLNGTKSDNKEARGRSRGRDDMRKSMSNDNHTRSFNTSANSPADDDEYDGETDMMLDRVAQLKGQIQERLSQLPNASHFIVPLKRFSDQLDEHAYQLTSTRSAASAEQLADAEYFVLYAEGWLEASEPQPLPNPWLNGWVEGKFGCSAEEVSNAVMMMRQQRGPAASPGGVGADPASRQHGHAAGDAAEDQNTVDAHLALSYEYEQQFNASETV